MDKLMICKYLDGRAVISLSNLTRDHAREILQEELEGMTPEGIEVLLSGNVHIPLDSSPFTLVVKKDHSCFAH